MSLPRFRGGCRAAQSATPILDASFHSVIPLAELTTMDVPFVSSGAMSRAHYALVRKVETATSPYAADMVLLAEVEAIQGRLLHSTLNLVRGSLATPYGPLMPR